MDTTINQDKVMLEQNQLNAAICSNKEYIWKNIFKIETIKKEDSLRKNQTLCENLQIKLK
ncbi:MAG: hypothetical protein IJ529_03255 [Alphaproteobacteria bacterium]|nr:hypothetical protein [Alphaproteobacteria bacterium]